MTMNLEQKIEAILFFKSEPLSCAELAKLTGATRADIAASVFTLRHTLQGRGVTLLEENDTVALGTSSNAAPLIEKIITDELDRDVGKAGLETLSAILYRGPLTRAEIDYIRGVNSSFILRHLLVRGLVERLPHPNDQRSFLYRPTFDLLSYLGVSRVEELPDYADVRARISTFEHDGIPTEATDT